MPLPRRLRSIVCAAGLSLTAAVCAGSTQLQPLNGRTEPWNGARKDFKSAERIDPDTSAHQPCLMVDLTIPVGRPGRYGFDAPCLMVHGQRYPCGARGVPPAFGDAMWAGTPEVHFDADHTLRGHVTLRFPGRELVHMPADGPWHFEIGLYRVDQDTVTITLMDGKRPVAFEVVTRPHRAAEFKAR